MEFLEGYASGDLPADTLERFELHLAACPSCAAYAASYKTTIRLARHLHDCDEADADLPNELLRAIFAARASIQSGEDLTENDERCSDVVTFVGARNLVTPHSPDAYPGVLVVRPGPEWRVAIIVPEVGQTVNGLGGERAYGYDTVDGGAADGFELCPGDRATLVRSGLPFAFVEWHVERPNRKTGAK